MNTDYFFYIMKIWVSKSLLIIFNWLSIDQLCPIINDLEIQDIFVRIFSKIKMYPIIENEISLHCIENFIKTFKEKTADQIQLLIQNEKKIWNFFEKIIDMSIDYFVQNTKKSITTPKREKKRKFKHKFNWTFPLQK